MKNHLLLPSPLRHLTALVALLLITGMPVTEIQSQNLVLMPDSVHETHFEQFTYSGISLDISNETDNARSTSWNSDGTQLYVTGRDTENVVHYTLSDPWDIGTAVYHSMFDLSDHIHKNTGSSVAHGLHLHEDGSMMWVFNRTEMWGYRLETPWDITSSVQTHIADFGSFVQRGHDFDFSTDGTRLFIDDRDEQAVHEVHLTEPWDISAFTRIFTLDISDQEKEVRGLEMVDGGTTMLLLDTGRKEILIYRLDEPYELQTARYVHSFDLSAQTSDPRGLSIREDLDLFYITGRDKQRIFQYIRNAN